MPLRLEDLDDVDKLFRNPPTRPLLRARPDFNERLWKRLEADRRARRRWGRVRFVSLAAAATAIAAVSFVWNPLLQQLAPVAAIKPPAPAPVAAKKAPASAPAASSAKSTPAPAAVQPIAPKGETPQVAAHRAPAKKTLEAPRLVSPPDTIAVDTTGTTGKFPVPLPDNGIRLAREGDGSTTTTPPPVVYRRPGLRRTPPPPPPGTPPVPETITVTPPNPSTTTNPPTETTTNPPTGTQR